MKRDTRTACERKADALLCAAKHWQHGASRRECCLDEDTWEIPDSVAHPNDWESCALAEVAAMGFDLESVQP